VSGKLRNIGWPYLVWSVITLAATTGLTAQALLLIPVVSPTFLWYLWFILAYYVIGWVCERVGLHPLAVALVALISSAFLPDFARMSRFAYLLFFFLLGHAAASRPLAFSLSGRSRHGLRVICAVLVIATSAFAVMGQPVRYSVPYVFGPVALLVLVHVIAAHYQTFRGMELFEYVGRNSLVFYVVHYSAEWIVVQAAVGLGWDHSRGVFLAAFVTALFAGLLLCALRERWGAVDMLFAFPKANPLTWPGSRYRSSRPASR